MFEELLERYGLDLDGIWNKQLMPHLGRHPNDYHQWVLDRMREIDDVAAGEVDAFLELYEELVKNPVLDNPEMLNKPYWNQ